MLHDHDDSRIQRLKSISQIHKQSSEQRELLFRSHVPNHLSEQRLVDLRCSFPKLPAHRSYLTRLLVSFKKQTRVLRLTGQGDQVPCAKILRNNNCGLWPCRYHSLHLQPLGFFWWKEVIPNCNEVSQVASASEIRWSWRSEFQMKVCASTTLRLDHPIHIHHPEIMILSWYVFIVVRSHCIGFHLHENKEKYTVYCIQTHQRTTAEQVFGMLLLMERETTEWCSSSQWSNIIKSLIVCWLESAVVAWYSSTSRWRCQSIAWSNAKTSSVTQILFLSFL